MIFWEFPVRLQDVWSKLSTARRQEIAITCAGIGPRKNLPVTLRLIAKKLHFREQTVFSFPAAKLATQLVAFFDSGEPDTDGIFRSYFFLKHKPMMASFLESLGIPHEDCRFYSPDNMHFSAADLELAVAGLLRTYPCEDVALYTQVISCQNDTFWGVLPQINFSEIEKISAIPAPVPSDDNSPVPIIECDPAPSPLTDPPPAKESKIAMHDEDDHHTQSLLSELEKVRLQFSNAVEQIEFTVRAMNEGKPPSALASQLLENVNLAFCNLVYEVHQRASELGIERNGIFESLDQIATVIAALDNAEQSQNQARSAAKRGALILESVRTLKTRDGRDYTPLDHCKQAARDLEVELQTRSAAAEDPKFLAKLKAFEFVLNMAAGCGSNDDYETSDQTEAVVEHFGAKLLFELGRGRIVLSQSPIPEETGPALQDPPIFLGLEEEVTVEISKTAGTSEALETVESVETPESIDTAIPTIKPVDLTKTPVMHDTSPAVPQPTRSSLAPSQFAKVEVQEPTSKHQEIAKDHLPVETLAEGDEFLIAQSGDETTTTLAAYIAARNLSNISDAARRLSWVALGEGKISAAYYLALAIEPETPYVQNTFSSRIRALALGQEICLAIGPMADQMKEEFSRLANAEEPESEDEALAFRLLLVSSALRTALIAPDTNAKSILAMGCQRLPRLNKLYWLCNQIMDYSNLQLPLEPRAMEYVDTSEGLSQHLTRLQQEAAEWWENAPRLHFKFMPAGRIWKKWLAPDGFIGRLMLPILNQDKTGIEELKELISRLSSESKIRSEVNFHDRQLRGRTFGGDMNSNSLSVFSRHAWEAVELSERWITLQEHQPSDQLDYRRKRLLELRSHVDSATPEITEELRQAELATSDVRVRSAILCCQKTFNSLLSLLHPTRGRVKQEPDIKYVLSSDLLLIKGITLSEQWDPIDSIDFLFPRLIIHLAANRTMDWHLAIDWLTEEYRDHTGIDKVIEYLRWTNSHNEFLEELCEKQAVHVRECQLALERQIEDCQTNVDRGVALGLVKDRERPEFLDRIERVQKRVSSARNFHPEEAELANILAAIETSRQAHVDRVRKRLRSESSILIVSPAHQRIIAALERGDVDTANEYIDLAVRGDSLPEGSTVRDVFAEFFPAAASSIEGFLNDPHTSGSVLQRIQSRRGLPGVVMKDFTEAQALDAVEMYEAWSSLNKTKRPNNKFLSTLMFRLGFGTVNLSESNAYPRAHIAMETRPLVHRDQSPVPCFGSTANGHYRIICIWDGPSEEEILNIVRQNIHGSPAIVLYFGRVSEQSRRYIAQLCQADNLAFILIDELLMVYLCGERGLRLPALFQCALPFTYVSPYTTTSSNVPPEMFYGRRYERSQIIDPMGSCFVYGGRQLGKTALLLSIKDEFHNLREGRVAVWIDLRSDGDDIWGCLIRAFKDLSNDELQLGDIRSEQTFLDRLQTWLQGNSKRRILLLLDEADRFLELDSKDSFHRTSSLKGLMERTKRRFKVVFAGLHNVRRTTKQQNQPLAHFGEAICVGPLLERGEWKEAKALIERPLFSMGFRFKSPDSVTKILSRTNYYPSLIQLYCHQIFLSVMRDIASRVARRNSPPYLITEKHVEDAYSSPQFGNAIKEKFDLTLNLDARYRVLALIIALNAQSTERTGSNAMAVRDIRENAATYWEPGFHDCRSEEDFRVLLEEMSGLGILREVNGDFALRTPNLLNHFGTQEDIESKLMKSMEETPPPAFESHFFRTSDRDQTWKRNPLSVLQESELRTDKNAVTLVTGTTAAGLDDLKHFLSQSFGNTHFVNCDLVGPNRSAFKKFLDDVAKKSKVGTTLALVQQSPWTTGWIDEALEWSKKGVISHFTNVVFVADPATTWRLLGDRARLEDLISKHAVNSITLQPWHSSVLWQWLGDCGIGTNASEEQRQISEKSGNWPYLLMEFRSLIAERKGWKVSLDEVAALVTSTDDRTRLAKAFGLDVLETYHVLSEMGSLGGQVSVEDLTEILSSLPPRVVTDVIYWADRLSLVTRSPDGEWRLDSVVKAFLAAETRSS